MTMNKEFDKTCNAFIDDISLTIAGPGKQMCMVVSRQSPIRKRSALSPSAPPLHGSYPHALDAPTATVHSTMGDFP
jgi:hypothetical protein